MFRFWSHVLIILCLNQIGPLASGQNKTVKLTIENITSCPSDCYRIERFHVDRLYEVPFSEKVVGNRIELSINTQQSGFYQVTFRSGQRLELVVSPGLDDVIASYDASVDAFRFNDDENLAYLAVKNILMLRDSAVSATQLQVAQVSQIDRRYYRKKESIKLRSDSIKEVYNVQLRQLAVAYPSTFTASFLVPQLTIATRRSIENGYQIYDNHHAFYHEHFFDGFPVAKLEILNHPLFLQQLKNYLNNFSGEFNEDLVSSAAQVFPLQPHPDVHAAILKEFLKHAVKENLTTAARQIIDLYMEGCQNNEDINKMVKAIVEGPLSTGTALPEFSVRDIETEKKASALGMLVSTKPNLLLFWKEGCPRCEEEIPLLNAVPNIDGYEVFLIALSSEKMDKLNLNGHFHQLGLAEKTEDIFERLGIFKTPTIVICDGVGRILKTPNSLSEL